MPSEDFRRKVVTAQQRLREQTSPPHAAFVVEHRRNNDLFAEWMAALKAGDYDEAERLDAELCRSQERILELAELVAICWQG